MTFARRFSNLVFAVGQAAVPALGYAGLFGRTIASEIQSTKTPVVPADYTFAVWAVIFGFCLFYAIDQMRSSRADLPLYKSIGWLTAAAFAGNTVWSVIAQQDGPLLLTGMVFLIVATTALVAVWRVFRTAEAPLLAKLATGSLAGWVTVAIFANWSVVLSDMGLGQAGGEVLQGLAFLSGATLLAGTIILGTRGALPYAVTIVWALIGLIVGNLDRETVGVAIGAAVSLTALAGVTILARRRHKVPHPLSS